MALACLMAGMQCAAAEPALVFAYNLFPPWKTMDAHGAPQGPYTELMREMARRAKLRLVFLPCPLTRCLQYLRQGKADVVIGVKSTPARREFIDFIDPAFASGSRLALYQRADDPRPLRSYRQLYPFLIGVVEGVRYQDEFDSDLRVRREPAPSLDSNFRKLKAGRIDALIADERQTAELAANAEFRRYVKRAPLLLYSPEPRRIGLSPRSPHKRRIALAMRSMLQDGTVARLLAEAPRPAF
ncbi:hypothetical protein D1345_23530 [Chromobacterium rhizoryzae]|uniref:Solute-binding protein family 3/N-terminal domain-containing protein n=2 Tax=Chromobacterium rhizoryzae TaxID=1778675 RepID=A0AAD0RW07_9NEIS|nr:hypothetical protein D1345_23530 [Chromobacterium rhizoryzae]